MPKPEYTWKVSIEVRDGSGSVVAVSLSHMTGSVAPTDSDRVELHSIEQQAWDRVRALMEERESSVMWTDEL